jgi:hypothetical protein
MNKLIRTLILIGCIVCPNYLFGQSTGAIRPDTPQAQAFFSHLQQLLKANDRAGISSHVKYPLLTGLHGKKTYIRNRSEFLRHFDEIFDTGIRCAILGSTEKDVWGNSHGFTIEYGGNIGRIWFDGFRATNETDYTYRLMTVNNTPLNKCNAERENK